MTIHDILLDPKIYENPHEFNPDRWLGENPVPECYFVPFGKGTRMCQGMRYAPATIFSLIEPIETDFWQLLKICLYRVIRSISYIAQKV